MRIAKKSLFVAVAGLSTALLLSTGAAIAGGWGGHGGGRGMGGMGLIDGFDTDKDGKVTQAEIHAEREQRLKRFDRDANGELSLQEYEALWLEAVREHMARQFQASDRDANGSITAVEFRERFADVVRKLDRNNDGEVTRAETEERRGRGPGRDRG
jgi:Ca2+-binding EF-hand superfamily protein